MGRFIHYECRSQGIGVKIAVQDGRLISRERELTIYPDGGHDDATWLRTYDGSAGQDIYSWMLDQRLSD